MQKRLGLTLALCEISREGLLSLIELAFGLAGLGLLKPLGIKESSISVSDCCFDEKSDPAGEVERLKRKSVAVSLMLKKRDSEMTKESRE